jgi:Spy/CpxP family protein refolding chaperone
MKINKLSMAIIAAASLLTVCPAVNAQTNENGGAAAPARRPRGGMSVEAIDKAVTLTDAEKPKVKEAVDSLTTAMTDARSADQSERAGKMRDARDAFDKKMKEILTPEQYTKFQAMPRPGRRGGAGGAGGGAGGAGGGAPPAQN